MAISLVKTLINFRVPANAELCAKVCTSITTYELPRPILCSASRKSFDFGGKRATREITRVGEIRFRMQSKCLNSVKTSVKIVPA